VTVLLDASGAPLAAADIARARITANLSPTLGSDYETAYRAAAYGTQETAAWRPPNRSGDYATLQRRDITVARVHDLLRNDRHARAGLERLLDMAIGPGLICCPKPDYRALGISHEASRDLAAAMKTEWRHFAHDPRRLCDRQRRLTMDGLWRLLGRTWFRLGEATAVLTLNDFGARYETSVLAIDPYRLCNPHGEIDTKILRGGVEMDAAGVPLAYHVRNAHLGDYWASGDSITWTRVPRETDWGRPVFVHGYEPDREGDTRGISPFVAVLSALRMLGKISENEAASGALNALFGAFITSGLPTDEVAGRLTPGGQISTQQRLHLDTLDYFEKYPARLGGVRIPVLPPGTEVKLNTTPRQVTAFQHFQTAFLQSVAATLGLSYEQLAMDWSRTNYSSARAALNEVWRSTRRMAAQIVDQVVTPIYFAVMDEAFDKAYLTPPKGAPDFMEMPGAYLRARWIGPGRGYIDPVKEAEGAALRMEGLVSTLEDELADVGRDLDETLDQIAFENAELARRGLSRQSLVAAIQQANRLKPDSKEAETPVGHDQGHPPP
jgi:lambda family phage portal protein